MMSTNNSTINNNNYDKKKKVGRFNVDILGIFKSQNDEPVKVQDATKTIQEKFASKTPPNVHKCLMQIWYYPKQPYHVILKSRTNKKQIMEEFSIGSMQLPILGQIATNKYSTIGLVFLSVLNKESQWEMFVLHPIDILAQEVTIKLTKHMEASENYKTVVPESVMESGNNKRDVEIEASPSIYSLSSTFINTWLGKQCLVMDTESNMNTSLHHTDLLTLNQNLKEIKKFMNELFNIMKDVVDKKHRGENGNVILPSRERFVEVVKMIKISINISVEHEQIIYDPDSNVIINQLFMFLRILGDATLNHSNGRPELVSSIEEPVLHQASTKFLNEHLNPENKYYWSILGPNFGYNKILFNNGYENGVIDEFHIRREVIIGPLSGSQTPKRTNEEVELTSKRTNNYENNDITYKRTNNYENNDILSRSYNQRQRSPSPVTPSYRISPQKPSFTYNDESSYNRGGAPYTSHQSPKVHVSSSPQQIRVSSPLRPSQNEDNNNATSYQHSLLYRTNYTPQNTDRDYSSTQQFKPYIPVNHVSMPRPTQQEEFNNQGEHLTWKERQCRFIDSVAVRNGTLAKSVADRSAKSYEELALAKDEAVEILGSSETNPNTIWVLNALGDKGCVPRSCLDNISSF